MRWLPCWDTAERLGSWGLRKVGQVLKWEFWDHDRFLFNWTPSENDLLSFLHRLTSYCPLVFPCLSFLTKEKNLWFWNFKSPLCSNTLGGKGLKVYIGQPRILREELLWSCWNNCVMFLPPLFLLGKSLKEMEQPLSVFGVKNGCKVMLIGKRVTFIYEGCFHFMGVQSMVV